MMRKLVLGLLLFTSVRSYAQENLSFNANKEVISPEINANKSVTFRLIAPNANKVELQDDVVNANGSVAVTKQADGMDLHYRPTRL